MSKPAPTPRKKIRHGFFTRYLHRAYFRSTGTNFFISRRVRPAGIGLCLVLILGSVLGIGHPRDSVYQVFSFSLGMAAIGLPWAFFRKARLVARRDLPRHATAGEPVRCTIRVKNQSARRLRRAMIAETPPDPRPQLDEFALAREPDEEKRNWFDRKLAYYRWQWLLARKRLFEGGQSPDTLDLAPGESTSVSMEITPLRRGVIRLNDLRVQLPDPFGLFQRCRKVEGAPATLTVLPRRHLLPPIEMPGSARFQIGGDATTNSIGSSGEFVGLRDYRPGDPLRQIHWKSWARTGKPIIKELEDTYYPRYGLVLDTFVGPGQATLFEEAVSVAASFVATIDTRESLLDLMFIKDEAHVVTAGRGLARAEKLLEVLAAVEADGSGELESLARLVLRHRDELTSCLIVFTGWDQERAAFLGTLRRGGVTCAAIIVGQGDPPPGLPGHWVESGHLARDLRKLPTRLAGIS